MKTAIGFCFFCAICLFLLGNTVFGMANSYTDCGRDIVDSPMAAPISASCKRFFGYSEVARAVLKK